VIHNTAVIIIITIILIIDSFHPVVYNNIETAIWFIQSGAEPTDTFQMVIDNIWKQGKISETVYKYV
jgi:hypothetical protein